ncbi:hypothetical protein ASPCADRAFT_4472 [Aspergillus carbonarius ITEM 5010]|uniref:Major facilitator superfamily (MFS) profile domain-containing protein n=1 Tax=Aspergillus carbonarius (strain ITEM 5010) TaxID=602072 RepID=A0A1R3RPN0_ASPC5|nr:hypothetical protein ASPCADRAFT_4472 [Aspergillus carbonarius ITEM 5010]
MSPSEDLYPLQDQDQVRDYRPNTLNNQDTKNDLPPSDIENKNPQSAWFTNPPPPDGGLAAWSVVLGAWCIGIFQTYYGSTLLKGYSTSTIAWIPSLEVFFMFFMGPIVGTLSDRLGARVVIITGSFLHVFGLMMASISTEYYQILLSQGVCSAMGLCAIFQPSMSSIPSWFDKKRGAAYGIVASGSSAGGIIFPIMVSRLIDRVGYGWAMRIAAFLILGLLVVTCLTVRTRTPPLKQQMDKEALLRPYRDVRMMLLVGGFVLLTFGVFIPVDYLETSALADGMSVELAQYLLAILNAGSLFGRMGAGAFSDKVGPYNIFVVVCSITGILVLALWIPATSNAGSIVFGILFGITSGAYFSLSAALVAKIAPLREIGYWTGVLFLFASIGGLTTNPIAGAILQHDHGSYVGMKAYSGVFLLAGSVFVLMTRVRQTGWVLRVKC